MITRQQLFKAACLFIAANITLAVVLLPIHYADFKKNAVTVLKEYEHFRNYVIKRDQSQYIGSKTELSCKEKQLNKNLINLKYSEMENKLFDPVDNFLESSVKMKKSELYQIIESMPKGGLLHVHDLTICSIDCLLELSYAQNLWISVDNFDEYKELRFSKNMPQNRTNSNWILLSQLRQVHGKHIVDNKLKKRFMLNGAKNVTWQNFHSTLDFIKGMITFKTVYAEYHLKALDELRDDGVFYVELRSELPILYNLDGTNNTIYDTAAVLQDIAYQYKVQYPDFFGVKLIYAPSRNVDDSAIDVFISQAWMLKQLFPHFFIGLDLLNQNHTGRTLKELTPKLIPIKEKFKFYFHAAETNELGSLLDEEIFDAMLLNTERIGNSFNIINHPQVLQKVKFHHIPIEVCPISNQMFMQLSNFQNHPVTFLLTNGFKVILNSDMPALWNAKPLTDDFYVTLLAMTPKKVDLRLLKTLCWNSLYYSAMNEKQKHKSLKKWLEMWDGWVDNYNSLFL